MTVDDIVKLAISANSFVHFQTMLMFLAKNEDREREEDQDFIDRDLHGSYGQD